MCPNDNPAGRPPHLPQRLDSLFDNEAGSDVTFLVGPEPETWRFPGHRGILSEANPVFRAMLQGPLADHGPTVAIQDVDGKAFDLLLRFLYREDVVLGSIPTALATLYAAHKYLCAGLVRSCVLYLNSHLSTQNVLQVYQHIRVYCSHETRDLGLWIASAPPLPPHEAPSSYQVGVDKDPNDNLDTMGCLCSSLLHNCLHYIDSHADQVLADESVEDLTADALRDIALRDSLNISDEIVLFNALERWCNRECKRGQLQLTAENRRSVLGYDLLFAPRYRLMTSHQFLSGPMQSGLLDQTESNVLMAYILNAPTKPSAPSISPETLERLNTSRRKPYSSPINLTSKSKKDKRDSSKKSDKKKKPKCKDKVKEKALESPSKKCSGSCFVEYLFRALVCIFD
ncbi:BTB/POZ domain-containing protein 2-like [Macrosteles quadrilineatus]|uniref:BTB/POZ domain-containing protein 2-like n=1 Tax=Macrosteles quadrilineatus TaxID=74068 RepID=UPI0023E093CE|nr:BTB/POZ domain-containing protein 2-like [Macrosteles quadrilineatus]